MGRLDRDGRPDKIDDDGEWKYDLRSSQGIHYGASRSSLAVMRMYRRVYQREARFLHRNERIDADCNIFWSDSESSGRRKSASQNTARLELHRHISITATPSSVLTGSPFASTFCGSSAHLASSAHGVCHRDPVFLRGRQPNYKSRSSVHNSRSRHARSGESFAEGRRRI